MSVSAINDWRLPGCGSACWPRRHDPDAHERYGYQQALVRPPIRIVRTGALVIDLDARRVTVDGTEVTLVGRQWDVLAYLAERLGRWCPADDIVRSVWGPEWLLMAPYGRPGEKRYRVAPRLVSVNVLRIKDKLGTASTLIVGGRGRGKTGNGRRLEQVTPL